MTDQDSANLLSEFEAAKETAKKLFRETSGVPSGVDLTQRAIREALGQPPYDLEFIKDNFSSLVSDLQIAAYGHYLSAEREVCGAKLAAYANSGMKSHTVEAALQSVKDSFFVFDQYFLSLTQSRRQRAGAAFEEVVQTLFQALGYPHTSQPILAGSKPDFVLPSVDHYNAFATDCVIFTCKRTLRERWRQVITEGMTGQAFYLATIDAEVTNSELEKMKERSVILVVPKAIKEQVYQEKLNVISFENFFDHHLDPALRRWKANGAI